MHYQFNLEILIFCVLRFAVAIIHRRGTIKKMNLLLSRPLIHGHVFIFKSLIKVNMFSSVWTVGLCATAA